MKMRLNSIPLELIFWIYSIGILASAETPELQRCHGTFYPLSAGKSRF